jgi:hypothetical protein
LAPKPPSRKRFSAWLCSTSTLLPIGINLDIFTD